MIKKTIYFLSLFFLSCRSNLIDKEEFGELEFSSSGCLGECPITTVKINKNKDVYFHGIRYTTKIGFFKGRLNDKQYAEFIDDLEILENYKLKENETQIIIHDAPEYKFIIRDKYGSEIEHSILEKKKSLVQFLLKTETLIDLHKIDSVYFELEKPSDEL